LKGARKGDRGSSPFSFASSHKKGGGVWGVSGGKKKKERGGKRKGEKLTPSFGPEQTRRKKGGAEGGKGDRGRAEPLPITSAKFRRVTKDQNSRQGEERGKKTNDAPPSLEACPQRRKKKKCKATSKRGEGKKKKKKEMGGHLLLFLFRNRGKGRENWGGTSRCT